MRILSTTPPTHVVAARADRVPPALTRRRHVDMMRVCSAACRRHTAR